MELYPFLDTNNFDNAVLHLCLHMSGGEFLLKQFQTNLKITSFPYEHLMLNSNTPPSSLFATLLS